MTLLQGILRRKGSGLIILSIFACVRSCERINFELEETFNDHLLFEEFTLGTQYDKSKYECAHECDRRPSCTVFSISLGANGCQLYGDVLYPDVATAQALPGRQYYVYTTDQRPSNTEFTLMRQGNSYIRVLDIELNFDDAVEYCDNLGARLIVLEEASRGDAVVDLIQRIGATSTQFFLGAERTTVDFVWLDGQVLTRDWWKPGKPNNNGHCLCLKFSEMMNDDCFLTYKFICEIPQ